ncbi:MAG: hypothetical protein U1E16_04660 [Hyphomicrobiales bacterium]
MKDRAKLAWVTQTTLSVDDEGRDRRGHASPRSREPCKEDICYATNRQEAVKAIAPKVELLLVVGTPTHRTRAPRRGRRRTARRAFDAGAARQRARLVDETSRPSASAGASAPELLVNEIVFLPRPL